jgi:hypothetical protein
MAQAVLRFAYTLDGPGIKSRWGARIPAPVHTGPDKNPTTCTMGKATEAWR